MSVDSVPMGWFSCLTMILPLHIEMTAAFMDEFGVVPDCSKNMYRLHITFALCGHEMIVRMPHGNLSMPLHIAVIWRFGLTAEGRLPMRQASST